MADIQKENGFAPIANEFLEGMARMCFGSSEFRVLLWVIRNTWGWKDRKFCAFSYRKIGQEIGLDRRAVARSFRVLYRANILVLQGADLVGIQKDFDQWKYRSLDLGQPAPLGQPAHGSGVVIPLGQPAQGGWVSQPRGIERAYTKDNPKDSKESAREARSGDSRPPRFAPPLLPTGVLDTCWNRALLADLAFKIEAHPDYLRLSFEDREVFRAEFRLSYEARQSSRTNSMSEHDRYWSKRPAAEFKAWAIKTSPPGRSPFEPRPEPPPGAAWGQA